MSEPIDPAQIVRDMEALATDADKNAGLRHQATTILEWMLSDPRFPQLLDRLAGRVAASLTGNSRFESTVRRWIREMTLCILIEQEQQQRAGLVRSFVEACQARGIHVWLSEDGKPRARPLERFAQAPDLRAIWIANREAIVRHLEAVRDLEIKRREREEAASRPAIAGRVGTHET